ncbi:MAG TPA: thiamine pyrophosphate-dependent enzyme [Nitrososphaerales archaeon]|nr:thiamine pyrophosphate-dependent enzyme [Nitrososphaerales archaeon]
MTESEFLKDSGAAPRVFSESDLFSKPGDVMYRRLSPDGSIVGGEPTVSPELLRTMYEQMVFGRAFDEKATNLSTLREIGTYAPSKGQEGAQIGFVDALGKGDWLVPMYRDNVGMLAFGLPPEKILQFWGGDERGMQIPENLRLLPVAVPVASQLLHAVGLAMASRLLGESSVSFVSTGDGGTSKGDFHEALNFAGTYGLPVVFGVENNQWAISVKRERQTSSKTIAQKAVAYGFEGILVDGNDAIACYEVTKYAVDKARRGRGPTLIEYSTYRMGPHTTAELVSNKLKAEGEVIEWEKRDPIIRLERYLAGNGLMDEQRKLAVAEAARARVDAAVRAYRSASPPEPGSIFDYMYSAPTPRLLEEKREALGIEPAPLPPPAPEPSVSGGRPGVNIRHALNMALRQGMLRDGRIVVFGEDVGKNGGVFQVTRGLQDEFGPQRVFDTPLAELGIAGMFVGLSLGGMVPVGEFQFDGFSIPALDQILGHVARMRNRTRGRYVPRGVLRFPYGAGIRAPEHHSESPEAHYVHTPGLKVVIPSNPFDAKGLMKSALSEPDPVIFMEPKRLYDAPKMEVPEEEYAIPIGRARVAREGNDITLISYGAMMVPTLQAADRLKAERSVSPEVLDLRTVSPLDFEAILGSVRKTGRAVIIHEAPMTLGVGAEVAATIADKALDYLKAPVRRVTGFDTVVPLAKLEDEYIPSSVRIASTAAALLEY